VCASISIAASVYACEGVRISSGIDQTVEPQF
jgi:hypothetical protein